MRSAISASALLLLTLPAVHVGAVAWHAWVVVRDEVPSCMIANLPPPEAATER